MKNLRYLSVFENYICDHMSYRAVDEIREDCVHKTPKSFHWYEQNTEEEEEKQRSIWNVEQKHSGCQKILSCAFI